MSSHVYDNLKFDLEQVLMLSAALALIWIMVPGLGFLYSGLTRRKSALSMLWTCMMSSMVGIFQWYFWGYSLAFLPSAPTSFIGNMHYWGFRHIMHGESDELTYPSIVFAIFQMQFSLVTLAIVAGATTGERGRFLPAMVFLFFWATVVYCPVVYWVWNANGWAYKWGVLDYAGGGPVEILSGFSAFVYSYFLGQRRDLRLYQFRPHNISFIVIGVLFLYLGWLFFNGMLCLAVLGKVPYSMMNTHILAAFGAITWCVLDWRLERKWSMVAMCSGCILGLVAATPASGCIPLWALVILGVVAGGVCNFATALKYLVKVDDLLDVLAEHGIAGVIGLVFNGLFGDADVIGYDGVTEHAGGWLNHNYRQLGLQIAYILACIGYSLAVLAVLCFAIDHIPGLHLRVLVDGEENGVDEDQIGEFAYDYVEVRREFNDWGNRGEQPETDTAVSTGAQKGEVVSEEKGPQATHEVVEGHSPVASLVQDETEKAK